jgi:hypothetical protein
MPPDDCLSLSICQLPACLLMTICLSLSICHLPACLLMTICLSLSICHLPACLLLTICQSMSICHLPHLAACRLYFTNNFIGKRRPLPCLRKGTFFPLIPYIIEMIKLSDRFRLPRSSVADPDPNPDPLVRGLDTQIRIHIKMSWIRNTA